MKGIRRLGQSTSRLYRAFCEAESVSFQASVFFSGGVRIRLSFYSMKDLFLKIKGSRILLDQGDQLIIEIIKIFRASKGQDHLIVQIVVVL